VGIRATNKAARDLGYIRHGSKLQHLFPFSPEAEAELLLNVDSIMMDVNKPTNNLFKAFPQSVRHESDSSQLQAGIHTMHGNQLLLEMEGVDTRALASRYIGKRVIWYSPAKKQIFGKITSTHGNNGVVRAASQRPPGTAISGKVDIVEK